MTDLLNSDGLRIFGYLVAAAVAMATSERERRSALASGGESWRAFWVICALLLLGMGLGQALDLGGIASGVGRGQARSENWYSIRRPFQAVALGAVALIWGFLVMASTRAIPRRRWRYLPMAIALPTLVSFAGIRVVSLHQVDTLLYRHDVLGVRLVAVVELALLLAVVASTVWYSVGQPSGSRPAVGFRPRRGEVSDRRQGG